MFLATSGYKKTRDNICYVSKYEVVRSENNQTVYFLTGTWQLSQLRFQLPHKVAKPGYKYQPSEGNPS